jgi:mannose-6-phosphate isomerase-like protein (cupin superfamily)
MDINRILGPDDCAGLSPEMFVVNHAAGEKLAPVVARLLAPVDIASLHYWDARREDKTELHYHDIDEYWAWTKGRTIVTIRLPDGRSGSFEVRPGMIVYCARGVEHGHTPLEDWACYEWAGVAGSGARSGHLYR